MKILNAKKRDISGCLALLKETKETHFNEKKFKLALQNKNTLFLVAKNKEDVIGYVIGFVSPCDYEDVLLQETRVSIKQRRKGFGTKLVNEFLKRTRKKGIDSVGAIIDREDKIGIKLYSKLGFSKKNKWLWYDYKIK